LKIFFRQWSAMAHLSYKRSLYWSFSMLARQWHNMWLFDFFFLGIEYFVRDLIDLSKWLMLVWSTLMLTLTNMTLVLCQEWSWCSCLGFSLTGMVFTLYFDINFNWYDFNLGFFLRSHPHISLPLTQSLSLVDFFNLFRYVNYVYVLIVQRVPRYG
jgi:hypothetical protein